MADMYRGPSESAIIAEYGSAQVKFGDTPVPLTTALQMERLACKGAPEVVQDPTARARRLTQALRDAGSLKPQHQYWLTQGM